jgi:hypothetical protein
VRELLADEAVVDEPDTEGVETIVWTIETGLVVFVDVVEPGFSVAEAVGELELDVTAVVNEALVVDVIVVTEDRNSTTLLRGWSDAQRFPEESNASHPPPVMS